MKFLKSTLFIALFCSLFINCSSDDDEKCPEVVFGYTSSGSVSNMTYGIHYGPRDESSEKTITVNFATYSYYKSKLDNEKDGDDPTCWEGTK